MHVLCCLHFIVQGLIHELVDYNLRRGSHGLRSEVRHLLCLISNNNVAATEELIDLLTRRVSAAVDGHLSNPDFVSFVGFKSIYNNGCQEQRIAHVGHSW
jgi:hypothetical protein